MKWGSEIHREVACQQNCKSRNFVNREKVHLFYDDSTRHLSGYRKLTPPIHYFSSVKKLLSVSTWGLRLLTRIQIDIVSVEFCTMFLRPNREISLFAFLLACWESRGRASRVEWNANFGGYNWVWKEEKIKKEDKTGLLSSENRKLSFKTKCSRKMQISHFTTPPPIYYRFITPTPPLTNHHSTKICNCFNS